MTCGQLALVLGILSLSSVGAAAALDPAAPSSPSPQVSLQIDPCVEVSRDEVRRWLTLELGEPVIQSSESSPTSSQASVFCDDSGRLNLRIDDPLTRKSTWRSIDLSSQDEAVRARLLAVAIAELLYASFAELLLEQRPDPSKPKPDGPTKVVQQWSGRVEEKLRQPQPPLGVSLSVVGSILVQRDAPSLLAGGGLRLLGDSQYHLGWDVDVQYLFARSDGPLGSVRSDLIGGRVAVHGQVRLPRLYLRGGAGLRLGLVHHVGEPLSPTTSIGSVQFGPWLTPVLVGSISVAIARLRLDVVLEGGYVVIPVLARSATDIASSLSGPQLLIGLGVGSFVR